MKQTSEKKLTKNQIIKSLEYDYHWYKWAESRVNGDKTTRAMWRGKLSAIVDFYAMLKGLRNEDAEIMLNKKDQELVKEDEISVENK